MRMYTVSSYNYIIKFSQIFNLNIYIHCRTSDSEILLNHYGCAIVKYCKELLQEGAALKERTLKEIGPIWNGP